jgi:hypothetical protein
MDRVNWILFAVSALCLLLLWLGACTPPPGCDPKLWITCLGLGGFVCGFGWGHVHELILASKRRR